MTIAAIYLIKAFIIGSLWIFSGCVVIAVLDSEDRRLLAWAENFPFGGLSAVVLCWPALIMYIFIKSAQKRLARIASKRRNGHR